MSSSRNIVHLSDREHVLVRPNMYIGETSNVTDSLYIFDEESQTIKEKEIEYNAGLFKIFDEILDNAVDETEKDKTCNTIKVNIFKENDKSYHLGYVPRYYCKELLVELKKGTQYSAMIQSLNLESQLSDENITANVKLILNI